MLQVSNLNFSKPTRKKNPYCSYTRCIVSNLMFRGYTPPPPQSEDTHHISIFSATEAHIQILDPPFPTAVKKENRVPSS